MAPASLYQTERQSLAKSRASVLSRPTTSTAIRASVSLTNAVWPQDCSGARRSSSFGTPSSRREEATWWTEGVPPGEPRQKWAIAAAPQESTMLASTDTGRPSAR